MLNEIIHLAILVTTATAASNDCDVSVGVTGCHPGVFLINVVNGIIKTPIIAAIVFEFEPNCSHLRTFVDGERPSFSPVSFWVVYGLGMSRHTYEHGCWRQAGHK
jgi:hypothetical protein